MIGKSSSLKTIHLIVILGTGIGTVFIILTIFMICYRFIFFCFNLFLFIVSILTRRTSDYRSKRAGGYGCNGLKNGDYKHQDKFDAVGYEYHTDTGVRIVGRKVNLSMGNKNDADGRYESEINGNNKRRGRRHRRRSSNGSGHRRLCRDTGDGNESAGAVSEYGTNEQDWNRSRPGGAQSDNDINNSSLGGKVNEELGNSIEKIIKFGSMPSYKY